MDYFEVHITEHCNLKCKSCDNFSPIAEEGYTDEETFDKELKRMSELFPNVWCIRLLGGEPLLNPNINFFMKTTRLYFPNPEIRVTTNATLLHKMNESFWKYCHDNNITIEYTYYPIHIDREKYKSLGKQYDVKIIGFNGSEAEEKSTYRYAIHNTKDQDINYNFEHCIRKHCHTLKNGNIYLCTCPPNICHFNKFFNKNLEVTTDDYINIYEHTAEEIDEYLSKPIPFCGYCNIATGSWGEWSTSKLDISEWYDE